MNVRFCVLPGSPRVTSPSLPPSSRAPGARRRLTLRPATLPPAPASPQLAKQTAEAERADRRRRVTQDCARLGSVAVQRVGTVLQEVWEEGPAFRELSERLRAIAATREGARFSLGAPLLLVSRSARRLVANARLSSLTRPPVALPAPLLSAAVETERKALKRRLAPPPSMAQAAPKDPAQPQEEYVKQETYLLMEESLKARYMAASRSHAPAPARSSCSRRAAAGYCSHKECVLRTLVTCAGRGL